jgi:His/Glu/Gln/Arg/opine family amino acid ABC transporter permease subunit
VSFDPHFIARLIPALLQGAIVTVHLAILAFLMALAWGLVIAMAARRRDAVGVIAQGYVQVMRNTPTLIQLYLVYYGLPMIGFMLNEYMCGLLVLGLQGGAYVAEIYRGGLQSISQKQFEAGRALGMTSFMLHQRVILPQMFARVIPPLTNQATATLKDTAQVATIAVTELTKTSQIWLERSGNSFDVFATVAIVYLVLTTAAGLLGRFIERRLAFAQ